MFLKRTAILFAFMFLSACEATRSGNPSVTIVIDPATRPSSLMVAQGLLVAPSADLCVKRLRFRKSDGIGEENIDLNLGVLRINGGAQELDRIELSAGTYTRVELDLQDRCGTSSSLSIHNDQGSFSTDDRISIRFDGTINLSGGEQLRLYLGRILDGLANVSAADQIKDAAESVGGDAVED